jgi:hypothetical protein
MLAADLADLYLVPTKVLNQAVRRNPDRFPPDFMFQLSREEASVLRSQTVTLEKGRGRYPKYAPFAFTEHGVAMLSSVLNSDRAVQMKILIIRALVKLRKCWQRTRIWRARWQTSNGSRRATANISRQSTLSSNGSSSLP